MEMSKKDGDKLMNKIYKSIPIGGNVIHDSPPSACFCVGPQNGEPLCPCQMRDKQVLNGRYVKIIDLGPVKDDLPTV